MSTNVDAPLLTEDELIEKAHRKYYAESRRAEKDGISMPIPAANSTLVDGDHVVLSNANGELARYRIVGNSLRAVKS